MLNSGILSRHPISVSGLRKLADWCVNVNMFDITYSANKSYYMVIDNEPRDKKKNIPPVVINNHTLSHTEKYKYLGLIIITLLMMMTLPDKKDIDA